MPDNRQITIRPFKPADRNAVRYICHATATDRKYIKSLDLVCALYCDYYIEHEAQHCFVLTDEFDKAVGYVLCAVNDNVYNENFKPYLKKAQKLSLSEAIGHNAEKRLTRKIREEYPAHLHIDILPAFQASGGGRKLISALVEHLKQIGIKGVRLTVGASNKSAVAFYERLGFNRAKTLGSSAYVYTMLIR